MKRDPYYQRPDQPEQPPQQIVHVVQQVDAGGRCPHLLHLFMTFLTCGLWLPVWFIHAIIEP